MKLLLTTLFFLNLFFAKSQFSIIFPDSSAAWNYYAEGYDSGGPFGGGWWTSAYRYYIDGDSSFYGKNYHKLNTGSYIITDTSLVEYTIGYFRVDSSQVYFVNQNSEFSIISTGDSTEENLLYDYSLQVGDTFRFPNSAFSSPQLEYYLDSITTINILGQNHRKFNFSTPFGSDFLLDEIFWIEGIGSNMGFFPGINRFEKSPTFVCFHEGGLDYSPNPTSGHSCSTLSLFDGNERNEIKIYPNPVSENLYVNREIKLHYSLFDSAGKKIKEGELSKTNSVDLRNVQNGLYSILLSKDNQQYSTRIVVIH